MNFKRVVITGLGTINPLGHNVLMHLNFARNLLAKLKTTSPRNISTRKKSVKWIFTANLP